MLSFIAPLFIVLSLAGIIVIVLRRTPEARQLSLPKVDRQWFREVTGKALTGLRFLGRKFWQYLLEVKDLSKNPALRTFPKTLRRIHLPKSRLPFFGDSDSPEFFLNQAERSLERADYLDAEKKFIKVIEKNPKSEPAYNGLGKLYLAQKKYDEAVQTYKYLVRHYPDNDSYHSSLGLVYHSQKLYDKAVESYEKAIELAPENPKRYVNLGLTLTAKNHLEEAILNFRRAVDMDKDNTQFLFMLAEALAKKGEKEQAETLLEKVLVLEPTNHTAREKLMQLKF